MMAQTADELGPSPCGSTSPAPSQMKAAAEITGAGQMAGMAKMDEQMKAVKQCTKKDDGSQNARRTAGAHGRAHEAMQGIE